MDLPEFLLARADELEAVARAATPGPWRASLHRRGDVWADRDPAGFDAFQVVTTQTALNPDLDEEDMANVAHIAAWDPDRVLAWCAAIRAVVDQYRRAVDADDDDVDMETKWITSGVREALEQVVRSLAQPFAGHPAFRPEWRVG